MNEAELLQAAKEFLAERSGLQGTGVGTEWYPPLNVWLKWLQVFAASVTQSQAAEIERLRTEVFRLSPDICECGHPERVHQNTGNEIICNGGYFIPAGECECLGFSKRVEALRATTRAGRKKNE